MSFPRNASIIRETGSESGRPLDGSMAATRLWISSVSRRAVPMPQWTWLLPASLSVPPTLAAPRVGLEAVDESRRRRRLTVEPGLVDGLHDQVGAAAMMQASSARLQRQAAGILSKRCSSPSGGTHACALLQYTSIVGFNHLVSSSVPALMKAIPGIASTSEIIGEPHSGQKRR